MLMHLSFGLLLLAVSVSAQDYYLTGRTASGIKVFNFPDYNAAASSDEKKERGINEASQPVMDYINLQYQAIKDADPNSPLLDELGWTARALVGQADNNGPIVSEDGIAANNDLTNILERQNDDFREFDRIDPETVKLANRYLAILNADVNQINGDPQRSQLALTLAGTETAGAVTSETIVRDQTDAGAAGAAGDTSGAAAGAAVRINSVQTTMEIEEASSASENPGWLAKLRTILQAIAEFFGFGGGSTTDIVTNPSCRRRRSNRRRLLQPACSLGGNEETMTVTGTDTSGQIVTAGGETKGAESDGTSTGGIETGGINPERIETGGITTGGIETGGIETGGIETGGIETGGISTGGGIIETGPSGGESVVEAI